MAKTRPNILKMLQGDSWRIDEIQQNQNDQSFCLVALKIEDLEAHNGEIVDGTHEHMMRYNRMINCKAYNNHAAMLNV